MEEQKKNYPGLDLEDEKLRIGVQVTATASLDKIKETLQTVARHGLHHKYSRIIVFILTKKQNSYSASAVASVTPDGLNFEVARDILDYRDLLGQGVYASPLSVRRLNSTRPESRPTALSARQPRPVTAER